MLLDVQNLSIFFSGKSGDLEAVRKISFQLAESETLGVVGESGSGKSITNLSIMGLLPSQTKLRADRLQFQDSDLRKLSESDWRKIRGRNISMIFQDPMTALNPVITVKDQMMETMLAHLSLTKHEAEIRCKDLLHQVGISSPEERLKMYPFELSGGMSQRVMIATAISCNPKILIADEPTTALDVTIQKQILDLISYTKDQNKMSVILVTHDLALVSQYADRIQVMYAGEIVESGKTHDLLSNHSHPYTAGLLNSRPHEKAFRSRLQTITGMVPGLQNRPKGCQFSTRCQFKQDLCETQLPSLEVKNKTLAACHYPIKAAKNSPELSND